MIDKASLARKRQTNEHFVPNAETEERVGTVYVPSGAV